jgi:hypothetical protein
MILSSSSGGDFPNPIHDTWVQGAFRTFDSVRTHDQGIQQEVGTILPDQSGRDTLSSD